MRDLGGALPRRHATWAAWDLGGALSSRARPRFLFSSSSSSGFFSDMFWGLLYIYKGYKSSLRDSISMWSPHGKICHIGPHQTIEIEFQRLEMLINNIVSELAY